MPQYDPDTLLRTAFALSLKRKELDAIAAKYRAKNMSTREYAQEGADEALRSNAKLRQKGRR